MRGEPGLGEDREDLLGEVRPGELLAGHVDRHRQARIAREERDGGLRRPIATPGAERVDQPGLLGDGDEFGGRDQPA